MADCNIYCWMIFSMRPNLRRLRIFILVGIGILFIKRKLETKGYVAEIGNDVNRLVTSNKIIN